MTLQVNRLESREEMDVKLIKLDSGNQLLPRT